MPTTTRPVPADSIPAEKAPGHWLLARLGKRVLRPGGLDLTRKMIRGLNIHHWDQVVEFAPGLGITAQMALAHKPASYTAIERDKDAAEQVRQYLRGSNQRCILASAHETGLPAGWATVVYGEAMLSMQPDSRKFEIVQEAARLLSEGGQYAIHELCLENVTPDLQKAIHEDLCRTLHVGATPMTQEQWGWLLNAAGLKTRETYTAPMALLEPWRVLKDEGVLRSIRMFWRLMRDPEARKRVSAMRSVFQKYQEHLSAIVIIAEKY